MNTQHSDIIHRGICIYATIFHEQNVIFFNFVEKFFSIFFCRRIHSPFTYLLDISVGQFSFTHTHKHKHSENLFIGYGLHTFRNDLFINVPKCGGGLRFEIVIMNNISISLTFMVTAHQR